MTKIVGVIAVKEHSNRFENKNIYPYKGYPLFYHNIRAMIDAGIEDIYVTTDSCFVKDYCQTKGIKVIWRGTNINQDEQPIFEVLKYVHTIIDDYDIMFTILANTIHVDSEDIIRILKCMKDNNLREVRSYNGKGIENGCMALKSEAFNNYQISAYVGAIMTNSKEIHYESEIKGN